MNYTNVLVVDDSAFMRLTITNRIEQCPSLKVVGTARNGIDAIEKIRRLKPDVVTMDVDMPDMDGITAVKMIMAERPVPIVMLSARTSEGAAVTLQALEAGAVDFFLKTDILPNSASAEDVADFHEKLISLSASRPRIQQTLRTDHGTRPRALRTPAQLVVIGCSTGGPAALTEILPHLPENFPIPVLVLQHMPPGFTKPLAERLDRLCHLPVRHIEGMEPLTKRTIFIAPSGTQTYLRKDASDQVSVYVSHETTMETRYRPSVDVTLSSATEVYGDKLLAVILTGMGNDGLRACRTLKQAGGQVVAEAEETCVVYGMPKAVVEAGVADVQVPLHAVSEEIIRTVMINE